MANNTETETPLYDCNVKRHWSVHLLRWIIVSIFTVIYLCACYYFELRSKALVYILGLVLLQLIEKPAFCHKFFGFTVEERNDGSQYSQSYGECCMKNGEQLIKLHHTHIDATMARFKFYEGFDAFRTRIIKNPNCEAFVHNACDPYSLNAGVELMLNYQDIYSCFGIHPHNAKEYTDQIENKIVEIFTTHRNTGKALAWGEMGLDYHYNKSPKETQKTVFARQLQKAVSLGLPLVFHLREADDDALAIIRQHVPKDHRFHVHCYTSPPPFATAVLAEFTNAYFGMNFLFSILSGFTGVMTFPNSKEVQESVSVVPLNRILLETDAPVMAPVPLRGRPCHSGMIPHIAQKIADIKKVPVEEVYTQTRQNTKDMYGI
ncbi:putative D-aminoacyl-tRNA deacylase [Blattamonas nauphoetae]|uniref:D-aminoacyl-tRNA deacylase n=1 Tax=Blattamonas nauphoetae TaxID=2049346 RepID=A0ABQ9XXJ8_9EUKA|nr:putative D-aminoacyl-tRNA deacylase [Blattamonas nauphoetae]